MAARKRKVALKIVAIPMNPAKAEKLGYQRVFRIIKLEKSKRVARFLCSELPPNYLI